MSITRKAAVAQNRQLRSMLEGKDSDSRQGLKAALGKARADNDALHVRLEALSKENSALREATGEKK